MGSGYISTGADIRDFYMYIVLVGILILPFLNFWGEPLWNNLCAIYDERVVGLVSFMALQFVVFWGHCITMFLVDHFKPAILVKYKVQEEVLVSDEKMWRACKVAMFNMLFIAFPSSYIWIEYVLPWRGVSFRAPFPLWYNVFRDLSCFLIVEEIGFYYAHRLFHHKAFYAKFHKLHHQYTAPVGFVAIYCTPVEMLVANLLPLMAGPTLMKSHIITINIWFMLALINTVNSHCGYNFPGMPSPLQHDFHHEKFNDCFGILGILDYIHGTNAKFLKHIDNLRKKQAKAA